MVNARDSSDAAAAVRLANVTVPENLTAIIDHYIARLGNEQRTVLSAAAVCGVEFRVSTVSHALVQLARIDVWTARLRFQGRAGSGRRAGLHTQRSRTSRLRKMSPEPRSRSTSKRPAVLCIRHVLINVTCTPHYSIHLTSLATVMTYTTSLLKETQPGEKRVALTPAVHREALA
jgi:hypothetical protein